MNKIRQKDVEILLYSQDEACRVLSLGKTTINELVTSGVLESVRIGKRRLIKASSLFHIVENGVPEYKSKNMLRKELKNGK